MNAGSDANTRRRQRVRQHRQIWEQYVAQTRPLCGRNHGGGEQFVSRFSEQKPDLSDSTKVIPI
jgi:hypothetical protein